ncbi:hypothetical protein BGZ63DRAFT_375957 [Mariannaea sp. PMI_226]|nr:hypothetical protein BGZ63DRAFT_375957 [Mariannaea sp. PMI_226]
MTVSAVPYFFCLLFFLSFPEYPSIYLFNTGCLRKFSYHVGYVWSGPLAQLAILFHGIIIHRKVFQEFRHVYGLSYSGEEEVLWNFRG